MGPIDFSAITIPLSVSIQQTVMADKDLSAIHIQLAKSGRPRLSKIFKIPQGALLEVCGSGFNVRTVKARYNGDFYFVFQNDIEASRRSL